MWRAVGTAVGFTLICSTLTACSDPLDYSIANLTDQELSARALFKDCGGVAKYRQDYSHELLVPPHQTVAYFDIWGGGSKAGCIHVSTPDGHVVFAQAYVEGKTYVVQSTAPLFRDLPRFQQLGSRPIWKNFLQNWKDDPVEMTGALVMTIGMAAGLFIAGKFFFDHYVRKRQA